MMNACIFIVCDNLKKKREKIAYDFSFKIAARFQNQTYISLHFTSKCEQMYSKMCEKISNERRKKTGHNLPSKWRRKKMSRHQNRLTNRKQNVFDSELVCSEEKEKYIYSIDSK